MSTTLPTPTPTPAAAPAAAAPGPDPNQIIQTVYLSAQSKQVQNAIAWLESMGAPAPKIIDRLVFYPGGSYPLDTLEFTAHGKTEPIDASLAAQMPAIAFNDLVMAGVILGQPGRLPNVPVPSVTGTTPKVAHAPTTAPAPAASNSPIASPLDPSKRGIGAHFQMSFAWAFLPVGTLWRQGGETFKLAGNIFSGIWWERTA